MKLAFRNITSFLFILLGLAPVLMILVFSLRQQSIRHQMKEKLESEQLHTIVIADNEIQWEKAGKEIWINGKMFDIKSIISHNGFTTFKGLFDNEETLLKETFNTNWEKNQPNQDQSFVQLFQTLQNIYFAYTENSFTENKKQLHIDFLSTPNILSQFLEIPTPPPLA